MSASRRFTQVPRNLSRSNGGWSCPSHGGGTSPSGPLLLLLGQPEQSYRIRPVDVKSAGGLSYTADMRDSEALDRSSFVPLYYQLQELIKEQIESGGWKPGDRLPSEPELARRYAVSRVVVRQALAILRDDGQIVRMQGRGTFVAEPKLDARAGGLARLLAAPRPPEVAIEVLEVGTRRSSRRYAAGSEWTTASACSG